MQGPLCSVRALPAGRGAVVETREIQRGVESTSASLPLSFSAMGPGNGTWKLDADGPCEPLGPPGGYFARRAKRGGRDARDAARGSRRRRLGRAGGSARLPSRASRGARALGLWTEPIGASMRRRGVEGTGGGPAAPGRAVQDARRTTHADDGCASRRREKEGNLRASRIVGHAARRRADAGGELPGADAGSHRAADAPPRPAPVHAASISACVVCVSTLAHPHAAGFLRRVCAPRGLKLLKARKCRARRRPAGEHRARGRPRFRRLCVCVPARIESPRAPASCPFAHRPGRHRGLSLLRLRGAYLTGRSVDLLRPSWPRKSRKWRPGNACRSRAASLQHPRRLPQHPNEDCASPLRLFAA
ncbi:hypothetical protein B0H15DRAFT_872373 [Mycena belliarum]|uniref:Uncharacterized protein n=1 Tax=Mycena belliarum TaxID=1033014 RepID=A0AAD6TLW0_9AGAR|nr:hypothetical protein B0H15DRAFT_872373 [Mycena belliae]